MPLQALALQLRSLVWDWYPKANELIYDNYNALAWGWSVTDTLPYTFCTMAVYKDYMHVGFYDGKGINDSKKILLGNGNQYRYIKIYDLKSFPKTYMKSLVRQSFLQAKTKLILYEEKKYMKDKGKKLHPHPQGMTIVKSVSSKKRR